MTNVVGAPDKLSSPQQCLEQIIRCQGESMNRIESLKALRLPRRSRRTSLRPGASGGRQSAFPVLPGRKFETPTVTRPRVRHPIASQIIKSYCFNNRHHQRAHLGCQIGSPRSFALQSICSLATVVPFVSVTRHAFLTGLFWNSCRGSSNNTNGQLILPVPYAVILSIKGPCNTFPS